MKLSARQRKQFFKRWTAICAQARWTAAEGEDQRRALLARAGFTSLKLVDRMRGYDLVKRELQALEGIIPKDAADGDAGDARRWRWKIRHELLPALGEVHPAPEAYLATLIAGVRAPRRNGPQAAVGIDALDGRTLKGLMITLVNRTAALRRAALCQVPANV